MDTQKLRSQVFEKTGVKIDLDDPVFAVVALNELVLEEAIERIAEQMKGSGKAKRPTKAEQEAQKKAEDEARRFPNAADKRMMAISAGAAVFGAVLVLAGQALWFSKPPAPPAVQARELTPAQAAALAEAEKLQRAIEKLDAKSRATIKAELQKP
jgi:ribosomal protein L12E/L44/L45/RPP1/RPP2